MSGATTLYRVYRTGKTAHEGRVKRRAADGYQQVLSLVEREAPWLTASVSNFGLDQWEQVWYGTPVPAKPHITDRATAAALISAYASTAVQTSRTAWREAADGSYSAGLGGGW